MSQKLFDESVSKIKREYEKLGHQLGWRFLYSPKKTLSLSTKLMLVGINPAGGKDMGFVESSEEGNAYRPEVARLASPVFQLRVCAMFQEIAGHLGSTDWRQLMDEILTSNFCPFRWPSWKSLPRKKESVAFSRQLWQPLCQDLQPTVVICLGKVARKEFLALFKQAGWIETAAATKTPTGSGAVVITTHTLAKGNRSLVIFGLPHPSWYFIVGNPKYARASCEITAQIVARIDPSVRHG